jgi:hypothetical protein
MGSLKIVYVVLISSKLEYTLVAWNKLIFADSNKLHNIQNKFVRVCYSRVDKFGFSRKYDSDLERLKFRTIYSKWQNPDGLFLYWGLKGNQNVILSQTVSLRVLDILIWNFSILL